MGIMATPGVYIFRNNGWDAYVGRSDTDVLRRVKKSHRAAKYDRQVQIIPTSSPRAAYLLECELFHKLDPSDNDFHPRVPDGTNWRCPVRDCCWS
jgi:excinuclease UvrABC nuclease subunit